MISDAFTELTTPPGKSCLILSPPGSPYRAASTAELSKTLAIRFLQGLLSLVLLLPFFLQQLQSGLSLTVLGCDPAGFVQGLVDGLDRQMIVVDAN
jgi:hypothetical protein